jgi:hypothetical protein
MEYTPKEILRLGIGELLPSDIGALDCPALVRRLRTTRARTPNGMLLIETDCLPSALSIPCDHQMVFGTEAISALEYFHRVIERGDMIDAVLLPQIGGAFPMSSFWIRIEYVGTPPAGGAFRKKDDGLFAMRAKAGEKAERVVARHLRDALGHSFPAGMCDSPGFFEIRYADKKRRKPDRRCLVCGLTFEIKKRNKDQFFRVSHSQGRPFASENAPQGWHAFVFPDMNPRFVPNSQIAQAIADGRFVPNEDQYDSWADIDPTAIVVSAPPRCTRPV